MTLNPSWKGRRIFFSRVNFVCWLLFRVCSITVLLQWHVKDPGHSAKSTGGWIQLKKQTPWSRQILSGLTMLSRHSVGTYHLGRQAHTQLMREHSTTVVSACWATVDWSWPRKRNWWAQADFHFKKKKSTGRDWIVGPSPSEPSQVRKRPPPSLIWVIHCKPTFSDALPHKQLVKSIGPLIQHLWLLLM